MLLFLIRHGDPIYSPDSLTPLGLRQAEAVAKRLALYGVDDIYTSTSNRAIQTAIPTCELLKKESTPLDWCNESLAWRYFTTVNSEGKRIWMSDDETCREDFASPEVRRLDNKWFDHPFFADTKCREGVEFIERESDAFFSELGYEHDRQNNVFHCKQPSEKRIALFAHAGFSLTCLSAVLDIPYPMICTHFCLNHSCITVIKFDNKPTLIPKVLTHSNDSHLYHDGLPTKYYNSFYF